VDFYLKQQQPYPGILASWQPDPETTQESEPRPELSQEPLGIDALRARWLLAMQTSKPPCSCVAGLMEPAGLVYPEWSELCYANLKRDEQVVIRMVGNCKCQGCGYTAPFTTYELHTRQQFRQEATWAMRRRFRAFKLDLQRVRELAAGKSWDSAFFRQVCKLPQDAVIDGVSPHCFFQEGKLAVRAYHWSFPEVPEATAVDVEEVLL
jgi:hypothetical protein